jgi:hypothetical protein
LPVQITCLFLLPVPVILPVPINQITHMQSSNWGLRCRAQEG